MRCSIHVSTQPKVFNFSSAHSTSIAISGVSCIIAAIARDQRGHGHRESTIVCTSHGFEFRPQPRFRDPFRWHQERARSIVSVPIQFKFNLRIADE
jgi:hypothetical protein